MLSVHNRTLQVAAEWAEHPKRNTMLLLTMPISCQKRCRAGKSTITSVHSKQSSNNTLKRFAEQLYSAMFINPTPAL
jgi:hypothetical protein